MKATGETKVYRLYGCANTKGVHKGLKGMYASETSIWDQFEPAVEQFDLTPEIAKDIADALNETHKKAIAANRREAQTFVEILKMLDAKEDRAYADFSAGVLLMARGTRGKSRRCVRKNIGSRSCRWKRTSQSPTPA